MIAVSGHDNEQNTMQTKLNENLELEPKTSKTRIKREMHALQKIGKQLVDLNSKQLAELSLPNTLLEAILTAKKMHKREAQRRQFQYIGKLMRNIDVEPILKRLSTCDGASTQHVAWIHLIERWRNSILNNKNSISEFGQQYPTANLQRIRTLARNTHKETLFNKPPKSFRALFHEIQRNVPKIFK